MQVKHNYQKVFFYNCFYDSWTFNNKYTLYEVGNYRPTDNT